MIYDKITLMRIHFLEFGKKGKPIVFLHGWQQNSRSFLPLVNFLCQNYRLFLLDLPGFGQSEAPPNHFCSIDYAKQIQDWIKKNKLRNITLVGHSFGGKVAAIIASQKPQFLEKLVLIASAGIPQPPKHATLFRLIPDKLKQKIPLRFKFIFASEDYKNAGDLLTIFKRIIGEDIRPLLAKIRVPTLILWGKNDNELPPEDGKTIKKYVKNSQLVFIGNGHFPFWENPKNTSTLIKKFIENGH